MTKKLPPAATASTEAQIEALTVAMIVAPGVYARNRMFDFLSSPAGRRARVRAGVVRGILPQLVRATNVTVASESHGGAESSGPFLRSFVLRYQIPTVRLTRVATLSSAELSALRIVAERANIRCLPVLPTDREIVSKAVARLLEGDDRDGAGGTADALTRLAEMTTLGPARE